ncbi:NAD(P)/FAD-dependent oxidoreductase [Cytophaga hutchinsonii]|uniref:Probable electron transfer flavoprotein n=1 Tax=Cytophaga hutchinsonii (strain ATCC 33406 / DSM 1761 / CIP 103989 / NBRC 15051 / NCIMB 9469 / D465) TaxID=269798 RepID=A0A6N4SQ06_CYTH3|nr:geranylgeranyl reductase family protein [Cytophaga hutchinsonii]ABG58364.1 probable electron transfer flavoprotein [Cytophaga hutchinsonii ATCC 33406]SFX51667.1 geranylgeranyl reductase family [Cytophaga hutchinsonii ATCC 33406]
MKPTSNTSFDVIILGAGPAGSTAALALQKSNLTVALLEKELFPRDKICGDALSCVAERVLKQIDPSLEQELLLYSEKTVVNKARVYSPEFRSIVLNFSKRGHCIKRLDFDNWLFEKANAKNIEVFQQAKVTDVRIDNSGAEVVLQDGTILHAAIVICCDGAHSVAARQLTHLKLDRKHYVGAVRQYYRNISDTAGNELEIFFLKDFLPGYFWIFPLKNGEANVGFGALSAIISKNKIDLKKSLQEIIQSVPQLKERFKDAEAMETVKGFGLPLGSRKLPISGAHFMLCGDAASLIDPVTGEGIETAMESGKYAAEQAIRCFESTDFSAACMQAYDQRIHKKMFKRFRQHYVLQRLISDRVWFINLMIRLANVPWINRYFYSRFE